VRFCAPPSLTLRGNKAPFEMHPAWVPIVDGYSIFARMLYAVNGFYGFERTLFYAARVLNAPSVRSQTDFTRLSINSRTI